LTWGGKEKKDERRGKNLAERWIRGDIGEDYRKAKWISNVKRGKKKEK